MILSFSKKLLISLLISVLSILLFRNSVMASGSPFTVSIEDDLGYFNLNVHPEEHRVLELKLKNNTEEDLQLLVSVNPVTTSTYGTLNYSKEYKDEGNLAPTFSMTNILKVSDEKIFLPPKSETTINLNLQIPKEEFEGILLGGIRVTQIETSKKDKNTNVFSNTIAIMLSEKDSAVNSEIKFNGISFTNLSGTYTIAANLSHISPIIVEDVTYKAKLIEKKSGKLVAESTNQHYRIAPNSNYIYPLLWDFTNIDAGTYLYKLQITSPNMTNELNFEDTFTLGEEKFNSLVNSYYKTKNNNTITIIIILLIMCFFIIFKKHIYSFVKKYK